MLIEKSETSEGKKLCRKKAELVESGHVEIVSGSAAGDACWLAA